MKNGTAETAPVMGADAFHALYRPAEYDQVLGQPAAVTALQNAIAKGRSRAFLFSGPSGVGKTTLARIAARAAGCAEIDIRNVPAAVNTGVDAMRSVEEAIRYAPLGGDVKAVILDEAHRLSKQAWESLLLVFEEPPPHAYWFVCTTEPDKIPKTIHTRCMHLKLKTVSDEDIRYLLDYVVQDQGVIATPQMVQLCVRQAKGSPRQALTNLATIDGATDLQAAADLLRAHLETDTTIEFCRFLVNPQGRTWQRAMEFVEAMEQEGGVNAEGVRIIVSNYVGKVAKAAKSDRQAVDMLNILEAFSIEYRDYENLAPLMRSIGQVIFSR